MKQKKLKTVKIKYCNDTAAATAVSAYIILKNGEFYGKAQAIHTASRCLVNLWLGDYQTSEVYYIDTQGNPCLSYCASASASGYGYNKEYAAFAHALAKFADENGERVFGYDETSQVESSGLRAIEGILELRGINGVVVLQAI